MLGAPRDPPGESYRYWREEGARWGAEYDGRKRSLVYYHLQEIMLVDYMLHSAPARVLDYGCGVGRHLRNLAQLPGLDVYGYDQSQAMVDGCLMWASPAWVKERIAVGEPLQPLPYPDGFFDVVYTSEVLVHVHPEHLERVLAELVRVSRWQVLHIEPSPTCVIVPDAHRGCWNHDLPGAYRKLGYACEVGTPGYAVQSPYRVLVTREPPPYDWSPVLLDLYRRLEADVQPALDATVAAASTKERLFEAAAVAERAKLQQAELDRIATLVGATTPGGTAARVRALAAEVRFLRERKPSSFRRWRRWRWRSRRVTVEAMGTRNPESRGEQVWILGVHTSEYPEGLPLAALDFDPRAWDVIPDDHATLGAALMTTRCGSLELFATIDGSLRLDFLMHDWSGRVTVRAAAHAAVIDLYAPSHRGLSVFPAATPMAVVAGG